MANNIEVLISDRDQPPATVSQDEKVVALQKAPARPLEDFSGVQAVKNSSSSGASAAGDTLCVWPSRTRWTAPGTVSAPAFPAVDNHGRLSPPPPPTPARSSDAH